MNINVTVDILDNIYKLYQTIRGEAVMQGLNYEKR